MTRNIFIGAPVKNMKRGMSAVMSERMNVNTGAMAATHLS